MKHNLSVVLFPQSEGGYAVFSPELSGCVTQGNTIDEALLNMREAAELMLEDNEDAAALLETEGTA